MNEVELQAMIDKYEKELEDRQKVLTRLYSLLGAKRIIADVVAKEEEITNLDKIVNPKLVVVR